MQILGEVLSLRGQVGAHVVQAVAHRGEGEAISVLGFDELVFQIGMFPLPASTSLSSSVCCSRVRCECSSSYPARPTASACRGVRRYTLRAPAHIGSGCHRARHPRPADPGETRPVREIGRIFAFLLGERAGEVPEHTADQFVVTFRRKSLWGPTGRRKRPPVSTVSSKSTTSLSWACARALLIRW